MSRATGKRLYSTFKKENVIHCKNCIQGLYHPVLMLHGHTLAESSSVPLLHIPVKSGRVFFLGGGGCFSTIEENGEGKRIQVSSDHLTP